MNNHQQQRMDEADRQFTDALTTANKANKDRRTLVNSFNSRLETPSQ